MSKFLPKRFKSFLDKKRKALPKLSLIYSDDEWEEQFQLMHKTRWETLDVLMSYYEIDNKSQNKWRDLSFALAMHFVPAMHYEEPRGAPSKWDPFTSHALCLMVEKYQREKPKEKVIAIYNEVIRTAQGTRYEKLLPKGTSYKKVERVHQSFTKTPAYGALKALEKKARNAEHLQSIYRFMIYDD